MMTSKKLERIKNADERNLSALSKVPSEAHLRQKAQERTAKRRQNKNSDHQRPTKERQKGIEPSTFTLGTNSFTTFESDLKYIHITLYLPL
jgi:hypothetical protein